MKEDLQSYVSLTQTPFGTLEVLDIPGDKTNLGDEYIIFFTPGNPGVLSIYFQFFDHFHSALKRKIRFFAAGHLGQSKIDLNKGKVFTIEQQLQKTLYFLDDFASQKKRILLIGHSFGCYLNLLVLQNRPQLPLEYSFFLFPVICKLHLPIHLRIACKSYNQDWMTQVISGISKKIDIDSLTKICEPVLPYNSESIKEMLKHMENPSQIKNSLYTGQNLTKEIAGDLSPNFIEIVKIHEKRSTFIITPHDQFVKSNVVEHLKENLKFARIIEIPGGLNVPHAYNTNNTKLIIVSLTCVLELRKHIGDLIETPDFDGCEIVEHYENWLMESDNK